MGLDQVLKKSRVDGGSGLGGIGVLKYISNHVFPGTLSTLRYYRVFRVLSLFEVVSQILKTNFCKPMKLIENLRNLQSSLIPGIRSHVWVYPIYQVMPDISHYLSTEDFQN